MGSRGWKILSDLLAIVVIILVIAGVIAYTYQVTYVTLLGTYSDYPYRGYVVGIGVGVLFCAVGSFAAIRIGHKIQLEELEQINLMNFERQCPFCGAKVSPNAAYCQNCAKRIR